MQTSSQHKKKCETSSKHITITIIINISSSSSSSSLSIVSSIEE
jgi:hypothetical protein